MCHTNSEVRMFPCQQAIDGNPNTLWAPRIESRDSTMPVYFEIEFNQHVLISGLEILQFDWADGAAKKIR